MSLPGFGNSGTGCCDCTERSLPAGQIPKCLFDHVSHAPQP
ncbi:DUF6485 family protein [Sphingobium sp. TomMM35A]